MEGSATRICLLHFPLYLLLSIRCLSTLFNLPHPSTVISVLPLDPFPLIGLFHTCLIDSSSFILLTYQNHHNLASNVFCNMCNSISLAHFLIPQPLSSSYSENPVKYVFSSLFSPAVSLPFFSKSPCFCTIQYNR